MSVCPWRTESQQWWTDADLAEIDVVAYDLVDAMKAHEEHCEACRTTGYGCDTVRDMLEAVVAWRDRRLLLTKAETLRAETSV